MTGFSLCVQFDVVTVFSLCVQFDGVTGFSLCVQFDGVTGFSMCVQFDGVTGFSLCIQFDGVTGFSFPLEHVRQYLGDSLDGAELHVYATVHDWFYGQEKTNHAWCRVVSSKMTLTFLGGSVRTFKPRAPLYAYVS